jgi:hypothetical protein
MTRSFLRLRTLNAALCTCFVVLLFSASAVLAAAPKKHIDGWGRYKLGAPLKGFNLDGFDGPFPDKSLRDGVEFAIMFSGQEDVTMPDGRGFMADVMLTFFHGQLEIVEFTAPPTTRTSDVFVLNVGQGDPTPDEIAIGFLNGYVEIPVMHGSQIEINGRDISGNVSVESDVGELEGILCDKAFRNFRFGVSDTDSGRQVWLGWFGTEAASRINY